MDLDYSIVAANHHLSLFGYDPYYYANKPIMYYVKVGLCL